jgi:hypothetical protein
MSHVLEYCTVYHVLSYDLTRQHIYLITSLLIYRLFIFKDETEKMFSDDDET